MFEAQVITGRTGQILAHMQVLSKASRETVRSPDPSGDKPKDHPSCHRRQQPAIEALKLRLLGESD
jgi:hypothetical protein